MNRSTVSAIEPNILHSPAVIGAVRHHGQSLDCRMPARPCTVVVDDRSNGFVGEDAFDPEDDPLANLGVGLLPAFRLAQPRGKVIALRAVALADRNRPTLTFPAGLNRLNAISDALRASRPSTNTAFTWAGAARRSGASSSNIGFERETGPSGFARQSGDALASGSNVRLGAVAAEVLRSKGQKLRICAPDPFVAGARGKIRFPARRVTRGPRRREAAYGSELQPMSWDGRLGRMAQSGCRTVVDAASRPVPAQ